MNIAVPSAVGGTVRLPAPWGALTLLSALYMGSGARLVGAAAVQTAGAMQGDVGPLGSLSDWRLTLLLVGLPAVVLATITWLFARVQVLAVLRSCAALARTCDTANAAG